jgi:hypothetical protein
VLADQVGVDFFGIGEHHTSEFPMPAADVALAAIAARTTRIHLGHGSSIESFPLFRLDLADYERLFEETGAALHEPDVVPHLEAGLPGLDRRGQQPRICASPPPLRLLADARHHRRAAGPIPALLAAHRRR